MSKTSAERQADLKIRREAMGQVRRPVWATPPEHDKVKELLKRLRGES